MARTETPTLPVIDIDPLIRGDFDARRGVAEAMGTACETTGFFYIQNHGIPQRIIDAALEASRRFFQLPDAKKRAFARPPGRYRGYIATMPFSEDLATGEAYLFEAFIAGGEVSAQDPEVHASSGLYAPNIWPSEPKGFREAIVSYWDAVSTLSRRLMRAFALALEQPEDALDGYFSKPLTNISLLHYPARARGVAGADDNARAHYDTDALTILYPGEVGGLQVLPADGAWLNADPRAGCFIVNIGNMLELWSGGRFRSTMHRVHPPAGRERYSIGYFANPNYDTVIRPLAGIPAAPIDGKPSELHVGEDFSRFVASYDAV